MEQFNNLLIKYRGLIYEPHGRRLASTPTGPRCIDKEEGVRTKPMKVILASMYVCEGVDSTRQTPPDGVSTVYHIRDMLIVPSIRRSRTGTFCKNMLL
jgi:hypothetical protein